MPCRMYQPHLHPALHKCLADKSKPRNLPQLKNISLAAMRLQHHPSSQSPHISISGNGFESSFRLISARVEIKGGLPNGRRSLRSYDVDQALRPSQHSNVPTERRAHQMKAQISTLWHAAGLPQTFVWKRHLGFRWNHCTRRHQRTVPNSLTSLTRM